MADIAPFRAVHYDPTRLGSLDHVVAPPYDVIDDRMRDRLYGASDRNVVRIILNAPEPDDAPGDAHRRAAECVRRWLDDGTLTESEEPALYLYRQSFESALNGSRTERHGVFCALRLSPYADGIVLPHEFTKPKAKADRLDLMRATRANTEPIMVLYEDPALRLIGRLRQAAAGADPLLTAHVGEDTHEVWRIDDRSTVDAFVRGMADRKVWIADGHHRYETALDYRAEPAGSTEPPAGTDRILVTLIPFEDPGLVVLPTHRMVHGLSDEQLGRLQSDMDELFLSTPVADDESLLDRINGMRSSDGAFIMVTSASMSLLRLKEPGCMEYAAPGMSDSWRSLDVSILQTLILDRIAEMEPSAEVTYTRFPAEAIALARAGRVNVSFIVGCPTADDVRTVTAQGDRMPAKSTFFDPKLWSGLLLRRLDR